MKKSQTRLAVVVALFGVVLVAAAIFVIVRSAVFRAYGVPTVATITEIERDTDYDDEDTYTVYVKYTVDGVEYEGALDYYSAFMRVGDKVKILYLPDNPNRMVSSGSHAALIAVLIIFGAGTIGFGVVYTVMTTARKRRLDRLKSDGIRVEARVKEFVFSERTRVMGKHPARIVCTDVEGNRYKKRFLYDGRKYLDTETSVTVFVDPKDPKKYAIDTDDEN